MLGTLDGLSPTFDTGGGTFDGYLPAGGPAASTWTFDGALPTFDGGNYTLDGYGSPARSISLLGGPRYIVGRHYLRLFTVNALTRLRFDQIEPGESWPLTFDFTPDLAAGETLTSIASVSWKTLVGTDATPAAQQTGTPGIDPTSKKVIVPVTASMLSGNDYQITVATTTSNTQKGPILVGVLPVRL